MEPTGGDRRRVVEIVPERRIVQAWRVGNWPDGRYSIGSFAPTPVGSDCRLAFDHQGFPEEAREHSESGWHKSYWQPLEAHLA